VGAPVDIDTSQARSVAAGVRSVGSAVGAGGGVPTVGEVPFPLASTLGRLPSLERRLGLRLQAALVGLADDIEDLVERAVAADRP
jgi:hypothetical protein